MLFFSLYRRFRSALSHSDNRIISERYIHSENLRRNVMGWKYNFVTIEELAKWTCEWVKTFPSTYDIIIGIPRSGLLVSCIVAVRLGKPLSTPELFCQKKYWTGQESNSSQEFKNILLIDDSISSGATLERSLGLLRSCCNDLNITRAVLIVSEESKSLVDFYYKLIPQPRLFEWNMLHIKRGITVSDFDGVICENCPEGVDSDEQLYLAWIKNAKPYLIPAFEIDAIVSSRLEKYRYLTQEWLAKHGVRYNKLVLWDVQSKQEREGKFAKYKIEEILKIKPVIIWESNYIQAQQIWKATKIPTLCTDVKILFA